MKYSAKVIFAALCLILVLGVINTSSGSDKVSAPIVAWLEPEMPMTRNAPITLHLTYAIDPIWNHLVTDDTGSFSIVFTDFRDNGDTLSVTTYPVQYERTSAFYDIMEKIAVFTGNREGKKSYSYTGMFQVILPDADTSRLNLHMMCGQTQATCRFLFIRTDEGIEFLGSSPVDPQLLYKPMTAPSEWMVGPVDRDTLTWEQLQTRLDMAVDLRDKRHFRIAQEILGEIPDTCKWSRFPGQYIINMTIEQAYKLSDRGIGLEATQAKKNNQSDDARLH